MSLEWKRIAAGLYEAGPYTVSKRRLANTWSARGPGGKTVGVPMDHRTMALAKEACEEAHAYNERRKK